MRRFEPFDAGRRIVVAVSGGADSMALAVLASRWGRPVGAVVDHGLRPESSAEAALTARRLEALGIRSVVVKADLVHGSAKAERARAARYALLFEVCRDLGLPDLLVAHHAADQAETVQMRLDSGSGPAGLAGMAPIAFHSQARLLRPLLAVEPGRLRATLRQAGVAWVEDPSNSDLATARGRFRAGATSDGQAAMLALATHQIQERQALDAELAVELGRVHLAPEGFAVVPSPLGAAALSALIWTISGQAYPPPRSALLAGLTARTVHGVLLRPAGRLGPGTLMAREPAAVGSAIPARAGTVWDGRFRLAGTVPGGLSVGALGGDAAAFRGVSALPSVVLESLPALRRAGVLWAVPHLAFPDPATCRSVEMRFWPPRPAGPAPFGCGAVNPSEGRGM